MKYILNILFILPLFLVSNISYGLSYFSVITDVEHRKGSSLYIYTFDIEYVEAEHNEQSPCEPGGTGCFISINHVHSLNNMTSGASSKATWKCNIDFKDRKVYPTMKKILDVAKSRCGLTIPMRSQKNEHIGALVNDECIGFFVSRTSNGIGRLIPGGACGVASQVIKCGFKSDDKDFVELNHGFVKYRDINGHLSPPATFQVECDADKEIVLGTSLRDGTLELSPEGGLRSEILLDGVPLTEKIVINLKKNEPKELTIQSRLKRSGRAPFGEFRGRVTIIMVIP